ncbi:hypothetical protein N657DRAFT_268513 [Parathielavia appendiculata]|uniref:Uncharacterized protein n=1 Tax=Parathielavia appendiculata TaxID=2587402 RepID=A0AAN6U3W9_9PEZI|nr:hypothetical protein N657DRAFT_268513 [Parathielavia appendiculata]
MFDDAQANLMRDDFRSVEFSPLVVSPVMGQHLGPRQRPLALGLSYHLCLANRQGILLAVGSLQPANNNGAQNFFSIFPRTRIHRSQTANSRALSRSGFRLPIHFFHETIDRLAAKGNSPSGMNFSHHRLDASRNPDH